MRANYRSLYSKERPVITYTKPIIYAHNNIIGIIVIDWSIENIEDGIEKIKPTKNSKIIIGSKDLNSVVINDNNLKPEEKIKNWTDYKPIFKNAPTKEVSFVQIKRENKRS